MKPLLIIFTFVCLVFTQDEEKSKGGLIVDQTIKNLQEIIPFPGMFEITEEMLEKIDDARAKHKALMEKIKVMTAEEKTAYFEKIREEAKGKMEAKLDELSPELKAKIKTKMDEIKTDFVKKEFKIDEFKTKIDAKHKTGIDKAEIKSIIEEFKARWKAEEEEEIKE